VTIVSSGYKDSEDIILEECMRRNKLLLVIEATMKQPGSVPRALWPMALSVCSPRQEPVGPILVHGLVYKIVEAHMFVHTTAVYRFEKVRATRIIRKWARRVRACIRLQCWSRQYCSVYANMFRKFRKRTHAQVTSFLKENAVLREEVALLRAQVETGRASLTK
jgi:phenylpropionate dioxygenase-like ring-hydroxylating dioxygenase large terminal subunit